MLPAVDHLYPHLVGIRQHLHAHPELGYQEFETARLICRELARLNIAFESGIAGTGIVATIPGSGGDGPTIGFRADIDALPIEERSDRPYRSTKPGAMHACGHDGHTAILLGLAAVLSEKPDFRGVARLVFQPAEEGLGGAREMLREGLCERFPMHRIYGLHNWPALPVGSVGVRRALMMAAATEVDIVVSGTGGHGAMPFRTTDQISVLSEIVVAINSYMARRVDPARQAVLSLTGLKGGTALTVIPDVVSCTGVLRTSDASTEEAILTGLRHLVSGIAQAWGADAVLSFRRVYPATINHPDCAAAVEHAAAQLGLRLHTDTDGLDPSMASEDFSFLLERIPGAYMWIGQGGPELHAADYDFNDAIIPVGIRMFHQLLYSAASQDIARS